MLTHATPLSDAYLRHHAGRVAVPTYDRSAVTPSVVHLSVGSFHRSHQAMYFDDLAEREITTAWGLTGVGLRRPAMREALRAQDGLYTVVVRGAARDEARVVGVIGRYLFAPEQRVAVVETLADARTRLVTLTITGNGYHIDSATGRLAADDPEVLAEVARAGEPHSALGFLVEALDRRRRDGLPPFTVLSCDNLADNGALARAAVVDFASLRDERLARWIGEHGAFPSSVVDRITPTTSPADREMVARQFGVRDRWPVVTEPFSQWIIEDEFCDGRPPLDEVGAQFVGDARPYALIKTRLLNGSHCSLGYLASLAGHRTIHGALQDPVFAEFITRLMADEVQPLLEAATGMNLDGYRASTLERLANPRLADQLTRLCRNGSAKMPAHVLPSIAGARAANLPDALLTFAVAGWLRYLRGVDERGTEIDIDDPRARELRALAIAGGTDPRPLLSDRAIFGELGADAEFVAAVGQHLRIMERVGTRGAAAACLTSHARAAA
jgi:mannitol-1-phosphate/altronate dehydrogenase